MIATFIILYVGVIIFNVFNFIWFNGCSLNVAVNVINIILIVIVTVV